jgi:spore maturation protein B
MNFFNYLSTVAVPVVILIILLYGLFEKKNVFDIFLKGANDGLKMVIKIFPTLIGLFLAIGALSSSGILDFIINLISPILNILNIPSEIMPLALLRPISGSGSIAVATDIMKKFGVDSLIGLIVGTIMGSTETTIYTIAVYSNSVDIKKTRFVLFAALMADVTGMIVSVVIWQILSKSFS